MRTVGTPTHGGFERHGDGGGDYRDALGSAQGWPCIAEQFVTAIEGRERG